MDYVVPISSNENKYVRVTVIIAYLVKETHEHNYNYTHIDDCYPDLANTHNLLNKLDSNDIYQVTGIEYEYDVVHFDDYEPTLVNTMH